MKWILVAELEKKGFNKFAYGTWECGGFAYIDIGIGEFFVELLKL